MESQQSQELERLYLEHAAFVRRIAYRVLGPDDADDAVQEVFLRFSARGISYDGSAAFRTWLYRVATNTCLNIAKSRARSEKFDHQHYLDGTLLHHMQVHVDEQIDIQNAVAGLSAVQCTTFLLHDRDGYRHHEIAARMGVPVGTSKARLFKARLRLRRALQPPTER